MYLYTESTVCRSVTKDTGKSQPEKQLDERNHVYHLKPTQICGLLF